MNSQSHGSPPASPEDCHWVYLRKSMEVQDVMESEHLAVHWWQERGRNFRQELWFWKLGSAISASNPSSQEAEDWGFEASLGYMVNLKLT